MSSDPVGEQRPPIVLVGADAAYQFLQRLVGGVALALPLLVVGGDKVLGGGDLRTSISAYYYGRTGNIFVGSLCALALFFFSYEYPARAGWVLDRWLSIGAGFCAIGVAMFPTASQGAAATGSENVIGWVHLTFAGLLFVGLGALSMWFFTKSSKSTPLTLARKLLWLLWAPRESHLDESKRVHNIVYRVCGRVIFASILGMIVTQRLGWTGHWFLWFECVAVIAFAVSWLVKGLRS